MYGGVSRCRVCWLLWWWNIHVFVRVRVMNESNERGSAPQSDTWTRSVWRNLDKIAVHREVCCRPWYAKFDFGATFVFYLVYEVVGSIARGLTAAHFRLSLCAPAMVSRLVGVWLSLSSHVTCCRMRLHLHEEGPRSYQRRRILTETYKREHCRGLHR